MSSLIPPNPAAKDQDGDNVCTPEHCYYAFDTLYCALTSSKPIPPTAPHLRGCIGNFSAMPLHDGLAEYALIAAFNDSRFKKIQKSELESLECGISLLTDFGRRRILSRLDHWSSRNIHHIPHPSLLSHTSSEAPSPASGTGTSPSITAKHTFSATYLPDVMPAQGWDKIEAVDSAIHKAGWRGRITEDLA
ncbi:hypothetical protein FA13DRAFT_1760493 [Coprinellus micaceus]|uniref:AMMECR1 domain-containing protein n=1 Tax=Coprinellus micaceus TaxID=71717 RepID=A0A4Y7R5E9_COPMI|nr:hypothetical protein FA13DRAFT_1760493 [Coprinellus micaceus]